MRASKGMLRVGIAVKPIAAQSAEALGGYWGRSNLCEPCTDPNALTARALFLEGGGTSAAIVALDLIGVSAAFAMQCRQQAASAISKAGFTANNVLVCCTHTHTGPSTHDDMIGFGSASSAYMASVLAAVVSAVAEAASAAQPAALFHARTPPLSLAVNRRERLASLPDVEPAPKRSKQKKAMWFEVAGATTLGEREEGPTVPCADVLQFVAAGDGSGGEGEGGGGGGGGATIATLFSYACHPVCCGKDFENGAQHADYVDSARCHVEKATGAAAVFVTGAAGDLNPRGRRGGGRPAAEGLGKELGQAVVAALRGVGAMGMDAAGVAGAGTGAELSVCSSCVTVQAPLEALPPQSTASAFLAEQRAWKADPNLSSSATPQATCAYAERLLAAVRSGAGKSHTPLGLAAVTLGAEVALLGLEAEPFSEYALHLSKASPFSATITLGYVNGCYGYLPTQAEAPLGGYEVVHAHVPYGQLQRLDPSAVNAREDFERCNWPNSFASPRCCSCCRRPCSYSDTPSPTPCLARSTLSLTTRFDCSPAATTPTSRAAPSISRATTNTPPPLAPPEASRPTAHLCSLNGSTPRSPRHTTPTTRLVSPRAPSRSTMCSRQRCRMWAGASTACL